MISSHPFLLFLSGSKARISLSPVFSRYTPCFDRWMFKEEREREGGGKKISVTVSNLRGDTISPITFTIDGVEMNI